MGRIAALVLSLAAIGVVTALLVWLIVVLAGRARAAYRRYQRGSRPGGS